MHRHVAKKLPTGSLNPSPSGLEQVRPQRFNILLLILEKRSLWIAEITLISKVAGREREKLAQRKKTYRQTFKSRLQEMFEAGKGSKRSFDKTTGDTKDKIYSEQTYRTYRKQFGYFVDWVGKTHPESVTLEDTHKFANEYLQHLIDREISPYTIATVKAAMAKIFGVSSSSFMKTPERSRSGIKRSRYDVASDRHISEATESRLARFTSATGLRRSEMLKNNV